MEFMKIVLLTVVAACLYGLVHDQITARICIEYFTVGHPRITASASPTIVALAWGIVATWWMGLILGIPLALAARLFPGQRMTVGSLVRPLAITLICMGCFASIAGVVGRLLAGRGDIWLTGWIAEHLPPERHVPFLTDMWIHSASYLGGVIGGLALFVYIIVRRARGNPVPES
ncbi:MAG: hypothetical protein H6813_06065 [Phycisphaeraceae bacterium]|nr:hypothetical protein [Phycisphaeraceae bacterium]MCB9848035.1 hypothetical protein [Phycisphaeraceae bacterium]